MNATSSSDRRRAGEAAGLRRFVALLVVGAALVALLAAGSATAGGRKVETGTAGPASLLPAVDLSATAATVWNCPGPLTVSDGSAAAVAVANPTGRSASLSVLVAETVLVLGVPAERALADQVIELTVPPHAEREIPVPDRYVAPAGRRRHHHRSGAPATVDASVSVTATGPEVAVSERVASSAGVLSSACATGSSAAGYTASGVTSGFSTVEVALFNPTAAPAVVNVSVGTPAGVVQPAAYQGLAVAPKSLYVVDLGRYVPLRARVAVAASATVGRVVIGSVTSVAAHFTTSLLGPAHSYRETGQALAVGVGAPLTRWVMPLGPIGATESEAVRIFDPGPRAASVTIETTAVSGAHATVAVAVASGQTVTVDAPGGSKHSGAGGVLDVISAHGVGIVVAHETYRTVRARHVVVSSAAPVAALATTWVVPGGLEERSVAAKLEITAGARAVSVTIRRLAEVGGPGGGSKIALATVRVAARSTTVVRLGDLMAKGVPTDFGLEVVASNPVLVTTGFFPSSAAGLPSTEAAVPAGG